MKEKQIKKNLDLIKNDLNDLLLICTLKGNLMYYTYRVETLMQIIRAEDRKDIELIKRWDILSLLNTMRSTFNKLDLTEEVRDAVLNLYELAKESI